MFLINLFIIIVSLFFNVKSKNEYVKPALCTATLLGAGYFSYLCRDKIKIYQKKKIIFGALGAVSFCLLYYSYKNYNKSWGPVIRPARYNDLVVLKGSGLNCFYCPHEGKDHTASVVTNILAQKFLSIESMPVPEMEEICKDLINEKKTIKSEGGYVPFLVYEERYYAEGEGDDYIAISIKEFLERAQKKTKKQLMLTAEERIKEYNAIPEQELIPGRVFDKKIPFEKVLEFVDFLFLHKKKLEGCYNWSWIIKKEVDTEILRYFFKNEREDKDIKKALAMDLLYGVYSDTCLVGGFKSINSLKSSCKGCEFHTPKCETYGAMTFLEHIIQVNKTISGFNIFKDKLINLGIIASIT